jgi:Putative auto-transporter adhesin, head GIN domain
VRRALRLSSLLIVLSLLSAACVVGDLVGVEGSGDIVTETREVSGFNQIVLSGIGRVEVDVDGTESLTITADDNIIPELEIVVRNGQLRLSTKRRVDPSEEILFTVTAVSLDGITLSGAGNVDITGVDTDDFSIDLSGSGNVVLDGIVADHLSVDVSGAGVVEAEDLVADTGEVDLSGTGRVVVNVTDELEISLSGAGVVEYLGSPSLDVDRSGAGVVTQRDG